MMKEVSNVILRQPLNAVYVFSLTLPFTGFRCDGSEDVANVLVLKVPKADEIRQIIILVVREHYPFILVIGDLRSFFILCHDESTDIILRRISEMAEYFFFAPFCR